MMALVWRIMKDSPNLPTFPAAKHSTKRYCVMKVETEQQTDNLINITYIRGLLRLALIIWSQIAQAIATYITYIIYLNFGFSLSSMLYIKKAYLYFCSSDICQCVF